MYSYTVEMLVISLCVVLLALACAEESVNVKLTYFNGRGNAEVSRMILHLAQVDFEDVRAGKHFEWQTAKEAGLYGANLNRLPVLTWDGIEIGQTKAIERFLAKRYGMLGTHDVETAQIEAVVEHVTDIRLAIRDIKARREKGSNELNEALAEFMSTEADGGAMHWVSRIEKYLEGHEGYAVGAQLSLADLYLQQLITYSLADADQDLMMSRYPRIAMIVQNVNDILSTAGFDEKFPLSQGEF